MLSIIVPFYNEESRNKKKLISFVNELLFYSKQKFNKNTKFILIDDGSTDNTFSLVKSIICKKKLQKKKIVFIKNKINKGYGYTLKRGFKLCKTKYVASIPSDRDLPFIDYSTFILNKIDLVIFYCANLEKYSRMRFILSTLFNLIYNMAFDLRIHYIQGCGFFNLYKLRKIKVNSNYSSYLAEITIKMLHSKIRYVEKAIYFRNKSIIDRAVSFKNLVSVVKDFIFTYLEVKIFSKKKYSFKSKKIYLDQSY